MKTILVPTDFSQNATNALHYAAGLAYQVRGKLIIAHIINLPVSPPGSGVVMPPDLQREEECQAELTRLAMELRQENNFRFEVETIMQYGYFMANLNAIVKDQAVDLVVMGTNGATNFLDKLVGTNTAQFMKMALCPVLAIPGNAEFTGIKNIAYASDFESDETIFLQQLFGITESFNPQTFIINILTERQLNIFADNQVVRNIMQNFPNKNCSIAQIQEGDVVEGLHTFVRENQADILAVSIHDRSLLESLFHTSISRKLVYHTRVPLLALPEKPCYPPVVKTKTLKKA